jgi:hypothetical protein
MSLRAVSFYDSDCDSGQKGVLDDTDKLFAYTTTKEGKEVPFFVSVDYYIKKNGQKGLWEVLYLAKKSNPNIDCRLFLQKHPLSK